MHIVIHTQYYPPELGAPQARLSELAQGLLKAGHQVTVLTAMPSYPQGKIYSGYGRLLKIEMINGIRIVRSGIYATQKANLLPRLWNYFSFVLSSLIIGSLFIPHADYWITESPPLFLGISSFLLSRFKHSRWIFNVSDLWPESAVRLGIISDGLALRLSKALESFCYHKAWLVSGQSKSILQDIKQRFPEVRTYHFSNGVNIHAFSNQMDGNEARRIFGNGTEIVAVYAGLHGLAQGLDQLVTAARLLKDNQGIRICLVGDGPEKVSLVGQAERYKLSNISFLDPVPHDRVPAILAAADICIVPLKTYIPGAVPSKLYEAMASSKPVVLIGAGEPAEIVESYHSGIVVEPGDHEGLARALLTLAGNPELRQQLGRTGRAAVEMDFNRQKIISNLVSFLTIS